MTGQPTAEINTPVTIGAGRAQSFLITLTPYQQRAVAQRVFRTVCPIDLQFAFNGTNTDPAPVRTAINTLRLTAESSESAPCDELSASAAVSRPSFTTGETLIAGGSITNPGVAGTSADVYVGIVQPDNSILFLTDTGLVLGQATDLRSFRPLAVNVSLTICCFPI